MKSRKTMCVTLHRANTAATKRIRLHADVNGSLPAVLVDPIDDRGIIAEGIWLNRNDELAEYFWIAPMPSPSRRKTSVCPEDARSDPVGTQS